MAKKNITLKYDGTTDKQGLHVTEVEQSTDTDTYLVAMKNQSASTAEAYADTIVRGSLKWMNQETFCKILPTL